MKNIISVFVVLFAATTVSASEGLDWTAWRKLPIFYDGRVMPLETFARRTVYQISGTENPTLRLDDELLQTAIQAGHLTSDQANRIRAKFPDGGQGKRTFTSYELLFNWVAEPELWDFIPFLPAKTSSFGDHLVFWRDSPNTFQTDYLGATGNLRYVTPYHVSEHAEILEKLLLDYDRSKIDPDKNKKDNNSKVGVNEAALFHGKTAETLKTAYLYYRSFISDSNLQTPRVTISMVEQAAINLMAAIQAHETLKRGGVSESELPFLENNELERLATRIRAIYTLYKRSLEETGEPVKSGIIEKLFEATLKSLDEMIPVARKYRDDVFAKKETGDPSDHGRLVRAQAETLYFSLIHIRRYSEAGYVALYDSEEMLHVCPILSAEMLKADRFPLIPGHPWLSLQTFLLGSDDMVRRFAGSENNTVRQAFGEMVAAYLGNDANRVGRFADASQKLAAAIRTVAEKSEPVRKTLLPEELRDATIIAKTAMPTQKTIHAEYFYEWLSPFKNMARLAIAAFCFLGLALMFSWFPNRNGTKRLEIVCFWCGVVLLILSELVTVTGGVFRTYFTGWLPIASKFETVVLMSFSTVALGFWATFYPLFSPRFQKAWRLTSLAQPARQHDKPDIPNANKWKAILLVPRALLTVVVFYYLILASYGEQSGGEFSWAVVKEAFLINDPFDWLAVVICIGLIVWAVPRMILAMLILPWMDVRSPAPSLQPTAYSLKPQASNLHDLILPRKIFLLVAAFIAIGAGMYANKQAMHFTPLQAVLRSNFWLATHIIAIIVSYASGAIAWLLAVIASGGCLFGKWRHENKKLRLPWLADLLLPYIKHLLGATVLFLTIGTVLGARWADYSWGRFWGWDPKEVWALVTLLFYAIVLHGRVARMYGDFGLILGALAGLFAILMTWYGVNEVLKGSKHAYASSGTNIWVTRMIIMFVIANIAWGTLACGRYMLKKMIANQSR